MPLATIYERLTAIFHDVFDDDSITASEDLTADQVDGWDSFAHLRLIYAVEKAFGVNFSAAQISQLKNVGDLARLIKSKARV